MTVWRSSLCVRSFSQLRPALILLCFHRMHAEVETWRRHKLVLLQLVAYPSVSQRSVSSFATRLTKSSRREVVKVLSFLLFLLSCVSRQKKREKELRQWESRYSTSTSTLMLSPLPASFPTASHAHHLPLSLLPSLLKALKTCLIQCSSTRMSNPSAGRVSMLEQRKEGATEESEGWRKVRKAVGLRREKVRRGGQ
jgi:hypothetical protein